MACYDLIFKQAFPFLFFILLSDHAISAWMVFKKQAVQLFTFLSCNSAQLVEKKIWKPVLRCFRGFHSTCHESQDVGIYSLPALLQDAAEAAHIDTR